MSDRDGGNNFMWFLAGLGFGALMGNLEQVAQDIAAESVFQHRVRYAHEDHDASRGEVSRKPSGSASGPSCDDASTPRRGRRW